MNSVVLLLATSLLGVDYQISEIEGESVYIVQIEEAVARELANGFRINSTIPSEYSHIRRIQIEVIADDEAGFGRQCAGDGDALLLPTAHLPAAAAHVLEQRARDDAAQFCVLLLATAGTRRLRPTLLRA